MSSTRLYPHWARSSRLSKSQWYTLTRPVFRSAKLSLRGFQTVPAITYSAIPKTIPKFAFAFDIDGVLVRGSKALPKARGTLEYLNSQNIPFILLTNGGGIHETKRATRITKELDFRIKTSMIVQSHSPFEEMAEYKDKTVLIVGGYRNWCVDVARRYGFKHVVTPADIWTQHPEIWPFSEVFKDYHARLCFPQPLPKPIDLKNPSKSLKIDAIFVYNDPRDWSLDATIILDCLLSREGILGTISPKNNNPNLPNRGYLQDGQPPLFYSNPDLWFAADYALPRFGQGGFRATIDGLWNEVTGGREKGVELPKTIFGKPYQPTYEFAERKLNDLRRSMVGAPAAKDTPLEQVYMVGDNPESDIRGANDYKSPFGSKWHSILLRTGVYTEGEPSVKPTTIQDDVYEAVKWAVKHAGFEEIQPAKLSRQPNRDQGMSSPSIGESIKKVFNPTQDAKA